MTVRPRLFLFLVEKRIGEGLPTTFVRTLAEDAAHAARQHSKVCGVWSWSDRATWDPALRLRSNSGLPRRGDRFEHARFITGSPAAGTARPEICRVTKVMRGATGSTGRIWYRTDDGKGIRHVTGADSLPDKVRRWLPRNDEIAADPVAGA